MPTVLSRRELFDLVWSKPVTKVAADFGLSDVAVHKICLKHRIPVPGRGYWAKLAAGKPVTRAYFREVKEPDLDRVQVHGSALADLPQEVRLAREKARAESQAKRAERKAMPDRNIELPDDLHHTALRTQQRLEKAKPAADALIHLSGSGLFQATVSPASGPRLVAFIDRLAKESEARGHRINSRDGGITIDVENEAMLVRISEKTDRIAHALTEKEQTAQQRWEADRAKKQRQGVYFSEWDRPKFPEWDNVPNGKLTVTINEGQHWDGLRRRFSDGKARGVEDMIDQIMEAFATLAAAEKTKRAEAEKQHREYVEREKRRRECERRRILQEKRLEFLKRPMERLEQAKQLDAFVADYLHAYPLDAQSESCRRLMEWASEYASLLRASVKPERLSETLDKYNLMDDSAEISSWISFD